MSGLPLVSLCVPVYGVEKYIERCAISLFSQTYTNCEFLFVNDCTKDNSVKLLFTIIERYSYISNRVKIIDHKYNKGLAAARNTALEHVRGEFLIWVDADDYLSLDAVEKLVYQQQIGDFDIVTSNYVEEHNGYSKPVIRPHHESKTDMLNSVLMFNEAVTVWGQLIKTSIYSSYNLKCLEGVNMGEDYQVRPLLIYHAQNIAHLDDYLYHYECSNTLSYTNSYNFPSMYASYKSIIYIYDKFTSLNLLNHVYVIKQSITNKVSHDLVLVGRYKSIEGYRFLHNILNTYNAKVKMPLIRRILLYLPYRLLIMLFQIKDIICR